MIDDGECGAIGEMKKVKSWEKTSPRATLSTTNPIWPDPGSNPGRRGEKPETRRLSYGAAQKHTYLTYINKDLSKSTVF
jgi:hypothetical protein